MHKLSYKGRSRGDDPSSRLILCGFATLSALMLSIKQLPAEACPGRNCSEVIFRPYSACIYVQTFFLEFFFIHILFGGRYNKDRWIDIICSITPLYMSTKDKSLYYDTEVLILMFMIIDEKMIETEYAITVTTRNKRKIITRRQRTKTFIKRKTHVLYIIKSTGILW